MPGNALTSTTTWKRASPSRSSRAYPRCRRFLTDKTRSGYSNHMKKATITEAKNQLSALIDRVQHGETIVITDRGRPVARLVSALTGAAEDPEGRLARLERRGGLRLATTPPPRALIMKKPPKTKSLRACSRPCLTSAEKGGEVLGQLCRGSLARGDERVDATTLRGRSGHGRVVGDRDRVHIGHRAPATARPIPLGRRR
jgi:prevent-host-death family protein